MSVMLCGFQKEIAHAIISTGIDVRINICKGSCYSYSSIKSIRLREFLDGVGIDTTKRIPSNIFQMLHSKAFHEFIRCTDRKYRCKMYKKNIIDYEQSFYNLSNYCYSILCENNIEKIIFAHIPHKGADVILYHLAKLINIDTILHFDIHTLASGYYTLIDSIEDIGKYQSSMKKDSYFTVDTQKPRKRPFYVKKFENKKSLLIKSLISCLKDIIINYLLMRSKYRRRMSFERLCATIDMAKFIIHNRQNTPMISDFMDTKYIYIPLHYEPEMSTDILGEKYRNQLHFLHKIREIIPEQIKLIVKENPAQTKYSRRDEFYMGISRIPNLVYIKEDFDTFSLIENAIAVATVSGTAGWEALRFGKPVVIGGYAWYACFPGVWHIDEVSYEDLVEYEYDESLLEKHVRELTRYYYRGFVPYLQTSKDVAPDLDEKKNAEMVAKNLVEYLEWRENKKLQGAKSSCSMTNHF